MILKSCKKSLRYVGLSNEPSIVICNRNLPNSIAQFTCILLYLITCIPVVMYTFEQSELFNSMNSVLYCAINGVLILMVYIDFIRCDVTIQTTLSHLEQIVLES